MPDFTPVRDVIQVVCARAVSVVDAVVGEIEGYVAIWGDPQHVDSYGTWFDRARPPEMALDNGMHRRPMTYEHAQDGVVRSDIIGTIDEIFFDDVGIRYRGHLDRSSPFFPKIVDELRRGILFTSSGTLSYISDFYPDGAFRVWFLGELALTKDPAESRMPASRLIRSNAEVGQNALREGDAVDLSHSRRATGTHMQEDNRMDAFQALLQRILAGEAVTPQEIIEALQAAGYSIEELSAALQQVQAPAPEGEGETLAAPQMLSQYWTNVKAQADKFRAQAAARAQVDAARSAAQQALQQQAPPLGGQQRSGHQPVQITVGEERRYAHMDAVDMATAYELIRARRKGLTGLLPNLELVPEPFMRSMTYKAAKLIEGGDKAANDLAVVAAFRMKDGKAIRANEVMQSTAAGFGDEWVGELQGTKLWEKVRQESTVYQTLLEMGMEEQELPQGFEGESILVEGSDPTWYVAAGAANLDANSGNPTPPFSSSKFGTGETSITVAKLSAAINYNAELEEDSLIRIAPEARRKIEVSAKDQIDYIAINADTATGASTNINAIDGTPSSAPTKPSYTLLNGLLKLALVTNTSNSFDAGTAFDETVFLTLLSKLAPALRADKTKLLFFLDSDTGLASLNIATFKTRDTYSAATIEEGELVKVWKVRVMETGQMSLATSNGKVAVTTPANNTRGRLGLVRPDQWMARWKRRMSMEVTRYPYADAFQVVAHMRWGMGYRDSDSVAVAYNIDPTIA